MKRGSWTKKKDIKFKKIQTIRATIRSVLWGVKRDVATYIHLLYRNRTMHDDACAVYANVNKLTARVAIPIGPLRW